MKTSLRFEIEIEGMRGEEEDNGSLTIMPCLHYLEIYKCSKLKSLPEFLRTIPLKDLELSVIFFKNVAKEKQEMSGPKFLTSKISRSIASLCKRTVNSRLIQTDIHR